MTVISALKYISVKRWVIQEQQFRRTKSVVRNVKTNYWYTKKDRKLSNLTKMKMIEDILNVYQRNITHKYFLHCFGKETVFEYTEWCSFIILFQTMPATSYLIMNSSNRMFSRCRSDNYRLQEQLIMVSIFFFIVHYRGKIFILNPVVNITN